MNKTDLTISRQVTINAGNYESVKPMVSLTIHDVPINKMSIVYVEMKEIINGLLSFETAEELNFLYKIHDGGREEFTRKIFSEAGSLGLKIESNLENLKKVLE